MCLYSIACVALIGWMTTPADSNCLVLSKLSPGGLSGILLEDILLWTVSTCMYSRVYVQVCAYVRAIYESLVHKSYSIFMFDGTPVEQRL